MINKRNEVFTRVKNFVLANRTDVYITSEYVNTPRTFPHISIEQTDSYTPLERETNSSVEKYAVITFTINVYSNKENGKIEECYKLMELVDTAFRGLNFRRLSLTVIPNLDNASIGRLTARYQVEADENGFYRR